MWVQQADPHPGNLIRTPDGRLAILDFGLVTEIDDNIKYGMIEAISHLIHRDYEAIVEDFVTLQFIDPGTNLTPILPVLAKVLSVIPSIHQSIFQHFLSLGLIWGINRQRLSKLHMLSTEFRRVVKEHMPFVAVCVLDCLPGMCLSMLKPYTLSLPMGYCCNQVVFNLLLFQCCIVLVQSSRQALVHPIWQCILLEKYKLEACSGVQWWGV